MEKIDPDHHALAPVDIALATYNGQRYLPEFLESISKQSLSRVSVYASDDGSSDGTIEILRSAASVAEVKSNAAARGIVGNFSSALSLTQAGYIALADQDDVWSDKKLELLVSRIVQLESVYGKDRPILVFCDLEIVDDHLQQIYPSFYGWSKKASSASSLSNFIISNHIPGCCMMMNRALLDKSMPMPANVRMHDWWIALVAASIGEIDFLDQALIKYRQHDANSVGVPEVRHWAKKLKSPLSVYKSVNRKIRDWKSRGAVSRQNVQILYDLYRHELSKSDKLLLEDLLGGRSLASRFKVAFSGKSGEGFLDAVAIALHM